MSCNIYEDPDQTMKVRYSKEVRGKGWRKVEKEEKVEKEAKVEKVVDIYESAETVACHRANPSRKARGVRSQKRPPTPRRNWYKVATVTLGLLCLLLLAGISVLLSLLSLKHKEHSLGQKQAQENQNQSIKEWQELRESHFYYASTEKKNWTESRKDCKSRGGDLVILNNTEKQEMIRRMKIHGDSWIGLETANEWPAKWKWVDGFDLVYSLWKQGVNVKAESGLKAYTDQQGLWMHNKTGLKYWICEKRNFQYLFDLKPGKNITKN
ncbi:C-type lectin domain family 2 member D-like isoform X2 [Xiphophorus hellerii]|uniref:C-type lectin domain family 2 member D-like isoform X2 n=1 Tax=Xiphophorus hellerii TaxID=8084 RepID=UPI0013B37941|nr:C-type lectin domain family 2 member D-like isoform X2 [Xiphophorus hellerii]